MKITHVVHGYYPALGGTEHLVRRLSERLVHDFCDEVTVLTVNTTSAEAFVGRNTTRLPTGSEQIGGVTVRRFPVTTRFARPLFHAQKIAYRFGLPGNSWARTLYSGPISWPLLRAALAEPSDVIAASSFPLLQMQYAVWAGALQRRPVVLYGGLHPEDHWGFNRSTVYDAISRADHYVAYTTFERDFLVGHGICPRKIDVIGLGTDPEQFAMADESAVRRHYKIGDAPVIAFIGQQGGHKGVDTLVAAMPLVWRKVPEACLLIAGARSTFSEHLDRMIQGLGRKRHQVIVVNDFDESDKAEIFASCDIFAYPSGFESFGIAFLEAWASKKPVVSCRTGAIPSVIDEWQDGLLVPFQDPPQLATALLELLYDENLRLRLGQNGYNKVMRHFTWAHVTAKFRGVFEACLSRE